MRPFGSAFGLLSWRLRMRLAGIAMWFRGLVSMAIVFGGIGLAVGYAIVHRLARRLDPDEDPATEPDGS